jgi:hypothetical protein
LIYRLNYIVILCWLPQRCTLAESRRVCKAWRAIVDARGLLLPHLLPHAVHGARHLRQLLNFIDYQCPRLFARGPPLVEATRFHAHRRSLQWPPDLRTRQRVLRCQPGDATATLGMPAPSPGPALGQGERGGRSRPSMNKGPSSRVLDVVEL